MPPLESKYQAVLIKRIYERFPDCVVLKNDTALRQGIPDLTILMNGGMWAVLEVKSHEHAEHQPNQDYYVQTLSAMSFAAFIYPENEEAVLDELQQKYETCRAARLS